MNNKIEWHQTCLENSEHSLKYKMEELSRLQSDVDDISRHVEFYRKQIALAEKEGKTSFDRDKYAIKRINPKG